MPGDHQTTVKWSHDLSTNRHCKNSTFSRNTDSSMPKGSSPLWKGTFFLLTVAFKVEVTRHNLFYSFFFSLSPFLFLSHYPRETPVSRRSYQGFGFACIFTFNEDARGLLPDWNDRATTRVYRSGRGKINVIVYPNNRRV